MKRKFKLLITLFLFLFYSPNLFAEDNCENFFNLVKNERDKYQVYYLPSAPFVYYDVGFESNKFDIINSNSFSERLSFLPSNSS